MVLLPRYINDLGDSAALSHYTGKGNSVHYTSEQPAVNDVFVLFPPVEFKSSAGLHVNTA